MKIQSRKFLSTSTPSVHASTVALWNGNPVFAWFGGSREGSPDVAIYLNNLKGKDETIAIGQNDSIPRWNPILMPIVAEDPTLSKLYLFEKAGTFCDRWQTYVHDISKWTTDITQKEIRGHAKVLPSGINGPVKTAPIQLQEDQSRLFCGSSVETSFDWTSYIEEFCVNKKTANFEYINRSNPLHLSSKVSYQDPYSGKTGTSLGIIQPALFEWANVHALFRSSRGLGKIYYSRTYDNIVELKNRWLEPIPTNLPNPNSGIDVVAFKKEHRLFLVWNPSDVQRSPLILSELDFADDQSHDITEREIKIKESIVIRDKIDPNDRLFSEELSYPYMVADEENGLIHLTYTYGRARIEYITIEI